MLHVIHSCASNSFSGLEQYVLDLVTWQHRQGHSVELYCREGSELCRRAEKNGVPTWKIRQADRPGPVFWARTLWQWKSRMRRLGAGDRVTLHLHAGGEPWYHLPWIGLRQFFGRKIAKVILHFHLWINHNKKDPLHHALYSTLDEIWTSSESGKKHLSTLLPVRPSQFRVVMYGRDLEAIDRLKGMPAAERAQRRARFGAGDGDLLAVCVSRIEPIKGVRELFDAFVAIAPRFPRARLAIIGDPSPQDQNAARLWRELKERHAALASELQIRLHLPGYLADANQFIAAADFYVLPSYEECMSLAMLDALALGRPVVGTDAGGTPSVVRPEKTGWLARPADTADLERALCEAFGDPSRHAELSKNAAGFGQGLGREDIFRTIWEAYRG